MATCEGKEKRQSIQKAIDLLEVQHPLLLNARIDAVFLFSASGLVGASTEGPYQFKDSYPNTGWDWSEGVSYNLLK